MTIIVTGGAGFIGSNVVNYYLNYRLDEVHVFDNFSSGSKNNLDLNHDRLFLHEIDLKNSSINWPQIQSNKIYHFAANADVRGGEFNREIDFEENVCVTKNICDYSKKNSIPKVVFSSSATVYGEPDIFPTPESYLGHQTSVYGASKLSGEAYLQSYSQYGDFISVIFRFVSWTGNGYSHGVIYDFVKKLINDPYKLEILGNGKQTKSYLDVIDGVKGVINISDMVKSKSEIFNLGHEEKMEVIDLAKIVCEEMGLKKVDFSFSGGERGWKGDSPLVHLDTTKAKNYGWHPKISIENSIRRTVRYLMEDESKLFRV